MPETQSALQESERVATVKARGVPLGKDVSADFPAVPIPDGATYAWIFVERTAILGTKVRALVRFEMSLDGGKSWGGKHRIESRDKEGKRVFFDYPLLSELWIDGVDGTPEGMSKDSGFGIELPDNKGRLIRSTVKATEIADLGVYYVFDDAPKRLVAGLDMK